MSEDKIIWGEISDQGGLMKKESGTEPLMDIVSRLIKDLEEYRNEIDRIMNVENKKKKWEPRPGKWVMGLFNTFEEDDEDECGQENIVMGRCFQTKEEADKAQKFILRAMRFINWVLEQDPGYDIDNNLSLLDCLDDGELWSKLNNLMSSGEVTF